MSMASCGARKRFRHRIERAIRLAKYGADAGDLSAPNTTYTSWRLRLAQASTALTGPPLSRISQHRLIGSLLSSASAGRYGWMATETAGAVRPASMVNVL